MGPPNRRPPEQEDEMNRMPHHTTKTLSLCIALTGLLAVSAAPALAGGLLGGVGGVAAGATGSVGSAVGLSAGGLPTGGLTGSGSGSGVLGATLGGNGLQPGFASGVSRPLSSVTGAGGRAWGTFEDAKGGLQQKTGLVKALGAQKAQSLAAAPTALGGKLAGAKTSAASKTNSLLSKTDGFALSRSFALPAGALGREPVAVSGQASGKGSASAGKTKVAGAASGSAQVGAGR
jgi:trimeric autotransporter adhesin